MPGAWLVLPTYNEAENLEPMIDAALPRLAEASAEHTVLVVDDGSPDGTGEIADRLATEHRAVQVLHRTRKEGLGRAYLAGFERALAGGADQVLEMDSDFSHDPADLPRLIAAAREADLVLGSRYVEGGRVEDWGRMPAARQPRRLVVRPARARRATCATSPAASSASTGACSRRSTSTTCAADGYGFQIELTYRAIQAGFAVREVPIIFRDRRVGSSKMNARIALEAVWKVPALRMRTRD